MNMIETAELLRNRRNLSGITYNDDTVTDWHDALGDFSYAQCRNALLEVSRTEKGRITIAHLIDLLPRPSTPEPGRAAHVCIRCQAAPPEPLRTRCAFCQVVVDEETAAGVHSPAMLAAMAAAHRKEPMP